jgi:hypothetical protein
LGIGLAFGGVTIHVGLSRLFYAWTGLCDRYVEVTAHGVKFLRIDPAVDHAVAVRADAAKGAGGLGYRDAISHVPGGYLGRAARQTENAAGATSLPGVRPTGSQEAAKFDTSNDSRALPVDRCQALPEPVPDCVLVNGQEARNLFHRVAAVDFGAAGIGTARSHVSAGARPSTPSENASQRPTYPS